MQLSQERKQLWHFQKGIVFHGRLGHRDDIEIGGRIGFDAADFHDRVAKHLIEPGSTFLGRAEGASVLDLAHDLEQVSTPDLERGHSAEPWQHVFGKDALDLRQRALAAHLQTQRFEVAPALINCHEGVPGRAFSRLALLPAMLAQIDSFRDQRSRFVASLARFLQ